MKHTTAAIIVASLFSLSSCHSHRAVESTAGLQTHTEMADSVAATRRTTASAKERDDRADYIDAPAAYALPTFACRIACGCNNTNLDNLYN